MQNTRGEGPSLSRFSPRRPRYEIKQERSLAWLADAHTASATALEALDAEGRRAFHASVTRLIERVACDRTRVSTRGHVVPDIGGPCWDEGVIYDLARHPHGRGTGDRNRFFAETVAAYFEAEYAEATAPSDLIHVTCTGYVSPSGGQRLVDRRGWGASTRVTHAYHMGCYAAFPALRLASGFLALPDSMQSARDEGAERRVDIVHTELCSLHFDPAEHSLEQLVVQSLFADGFIRYAVTDGASAEVEPGLRLLAISEAIVPGSAASMSWRVGDHGMAMTLSRHVPEQVGGVLPGFVRDLYARAGLDAGLEMPGSVFAVHPGGPKVIDAVRDRLELSDAQVQTSRDVLFDHGNMSSATLPHVWMRIVNDAGVPSGTLVLSVAFGPGLTVSGALFRKH
jgi:predicted naringenin-chalcone synthase